MADNYCSNCGTKLALGTKFCAKCGHSVKSKKEPTITTAKEDSREPTELEKKKMPVRTEGFVLIAAAIVCWLIASAALGSNSFIGGFLGIVAILLFLIGLVKIIRGK